MEYDGVLVRFGEIGIKSAPVRRQMLNRLRQNILDGLLRNGVEGDVHPKGARLWLVGPDTESLLQVATKTFGVVSASPTITAPTTMDAMGEAAARLALDASNGDWTSFAIRARREGEQPFSSMDVGVNVGSAVFKAAEAAGRTPKVDLSNPDLEIHVDVRTSGAYLSTHSVAGPGGLPAGAQGHVAILMDRPDSDVAAWFMMRRGCKITYAGPASEALKTWGGPTKGNDVATVDAAWDQFSVDAVVTADTLDDPIAVSEFPILRPLCGLATSEVERIRTLIAA